MQKVGHAKMRDMGELSAWWVVRPETGPTKTGQPVVSARSWWLPDGHGLAGDAQLRAAPTANRRLLMGAARSRTCSCDGP